MTISLGQSPDWPWQIYMDNLEIGPDLIIKT
jgi:hypothetical protein